MKPSLTLRQSSPRFIPPWEQQRFWAVICEDVSVGTIVEHPTPGDVLPPWHWTLHVHAGRYGNGGRQVTAFEGSGLSRDDCLEPFRRAFQAYFDFIGPEGWQHHLDHMERISAPSGNWVPDDAGI